jgi:MFS family permease
VLLPAILVEAAAAALFLAPPTLPGLIVARFLTGIGVGLVVATATAYLSELHLTARPDASRGRADLLATVANMGGIGLGPLVSGMLAQYVTGPLQTPFVIFLALLLCCALAVGVVPETVRRPERPARYRPQRVSVPSAARRPYFAATAAGFTAFAVLGLFTSLAPSFVSDMLDHPSKAIAGTVAFGVFAAGAAAQAMLGSWSARRQVAAGLSMMAAGLVPVTLGVWLPSLPVFLAGGAVAGAGAGTLVKGAISTVSAISAQESRGEALAGVFLAGYAGLTVPVLALGVATQLIAVRLAMLGFSAVVLTAIMALGRRLLATPAQRVPGLAAAPGTS